MSRSIDRIIHDVENLKPKFCYPKLILMNQSKLYMSPCMRVRKKQEFLEKAIPPGFYRSNDEDIKMIGVSSIDSLFRNIKLDENGTKEESTLGNNDPTTLENYQSCEFFDNSGFGEVMTLVDVNPTERTWMSARGGEGVNRRFKIITV